VTVATSIAERSPGIETFPVRRRPLFIKEVQAPMSPNVRRWFELPRLIQEYRRRNPLVLVNGLAEQSESWFANRTHLSRHFDLKVPEILVYDGDALHQWIDSGGEVTIDYLADRLGRFLDEFVQRPPYHLCGSSLGCQIILNYAVRNPAKVSKLVLICPSGFHGDENLPVIDGVSRSNYNSLVKSVFHRGHFASDELVRAFERKFQDRRWKKGVLRTLRGSVGHSVRPLLTLVPHPTLVIWGANDRVLSDVPGAIRAAEQILKVRQVVIPKCGHAPQIEKSRLVNQLVSRFLRDKLRVIPPALEASRFLSQRSEPVRPRAGFLASPLSSHPGR
jgi:abhydrolase domain-containing protein 6